MALLISPLGGCASYSAKISGTPRAGAEQLLLTGAAERAIGCVDFRPLAGEAVFLDASRVLAADSAWLVFDLRREMARQGVLLVDDREEARVVVEAAVGAYGTDEVDRRLSTPGFTSFGPFSLLPANSDPHAYERKSRQDAMVKLALVGTDAGTHRLVWETGTILRPESIDREFLGSHEVGRRSTLPELDDYTGRSGRR